MRGVVFLGNRELELREFPDPVPGPRDVVIEIKASGICGTDLHLYRHSGDGPAIPGMDTSEPSIGGHEPCGVVVEVGSAVRESEAYVGQRKAKDVLPETEKAWKKIVRKIGKKKLKAELASYKALFPKVNVPS